MIKALEFEDFCQPAKVFIKIKTIRYYDNYGFSIRQTIRYAKRHCVGSNFVALDMVENGVSYVLDKLEDDISEYEDGIYEVVMYNISPDYETGEIGDYQYRLVLYEEVE